MILTFLFLSLFPLMFLKSWRVSAEQDAALMALERPPTCEGVKDVCADLFWWILCGIAALVLFLFNLINKALTAFWKWDFTEWLCRITGNGFDPNGCKFPVWDYDPNAKNEKTFEVKAAEYVERDGETVIVYDGVTYRNAKRKGEAKEINLTAEEIEAVANYPNPKLNNLTYASDVKEWFAKGKSDYEIGLLAGCGQSYARHYRLALGLLRPSPIRVAG